MKNTIRTKLFLIVAVVVTAFLANIIINRYFIHRTQVELEHIQNKIFGKINLIVRLQSDIKKIQRQYRDAYSSLEKSWLDEARAGEKTILSLIENEREVLGGDFTAAIKSSLQKYFLHASSVIQRVVEGETGEKIVEDLGMLQKLQSKLLDFLNDSLDDLYKELAASFKTAIDTQTKLSDANYIVGMISLLLVFVIALWISRNIVKSLRLLTEGLTRFGAGQFSLPIEVVGNDDFSHASTIANEMAAMLEKNKIEKDEEYWLKDMKSSLSSCFSGDQAPNEFVNSFIKFLGHHLEAHLGGFYFVEGEEVYRFKDFDKKNRSVEFNLGEGVLGQVLLRNELSIIRIHELDDEESDFTINHSVKPHEIVYLPLYQYEKPFGLVELLFFKEIDAQTKIFINSAAEIILTAMNVSISRRNIENLLEETQEQAKKLMEQENDLQASNEELQSQRTELEQINLTLEEQKEVLESEKIKLEELTYELEASRREVEEKANMAEEANRYKSQFLANMSHELRTPLNSIMVLSQILAENRTENLLEGQVKSASIIHSAGEDLLTLIDDILDLAKIEAGKLEIIPEKIFFSSVIDNLESLFKAQTEAKGVKLSFKIDKECPEAFYTDQKRLEQILKNLLSNALKFTEKGFINVLFQPVLQDAYKKQSNMVKITVQDTGIGISKEKLKFVFEAFQQADSSINRKYSGTGLGLTISKNLVLKLGGDLEVESELGEGSSFILTLKELRPEVLRTIAHKEKNTENVERILPGVKGSEEGDVILIVEDNIMFSNVLKNRCTEFNFKSIQCTSAEDALTILRDTSVVAILLDVILPGMSGLDLLRKIRSDANYRDIPVHILSVDNVEERAIQLEANTFHQKPVSLESLNKILFQIEKHLDSGRSKILLLNLEEEEITFISKNFQDAEIIAKSIESLNMAELGSILKSCICAVVGINSIEVDLHPFVEAINRENNLYKLPVVFLTDDSLYEGVRHNVGHFERAVILKKAVNDKRLLDEVSIFLHQIEEGLDKTQMKSMKIEGDVLQNKTVLVAEDDQRNIYTMHEVLTTYGMKVISVENGEDVLKALKENSKIDIVLMDVMMPVMDGLEATKKIREQKMFDNLPIIVITAKAMKNDREMCMEVGANDYLAKPVDIDELLQLLKIWLSQV